ncbi:MAG: hypothetical protein HQK96_11745 [Nitrospirae bacterium]|nr:hypothetical protein [Nitrospirota bacterium]
MSTDEIIIYFSRATIHFIYSFLPVFDEKRINLSVEGLKNLYRKNKGRPANRRGIKPYLDLDLEMGYETGETYQASLGDLDIMIEPTMRFFPLGSTCCLSTTVSKRNDTLLSLNDIHAILGLVQSKEADPQSARFIKIEDQKKSFYELFQHIIEQLLINVNEKLKVGEKTSNEIREYGILCNKHLTESSEPQTPWVVTVLDVSDPAVNVFCGTFCNDESPMRAKSTAIRKYEESIAPILFRSVTGADFMLEPAYIRSAHLERLSGISNMNVDARLFVTMSRRSILCMCKKQDDDPAAYFVPVLLDLCEMTRARWHTLVIMNKIIDESMKNFRVGKGALSPKERLQKIINLSDKFIACLEDPSAYVCSGDALREIHERLLDTFKIKDMTEVALKKLDMLERLFSHGLEMSWADEH